MTAPTVVSSSIGQTNQAPTYLPSTIHTVPYPSGSGGIVIAFISHGDPSGTVTITSWPGWTRLGSRGAFGIVDGYGDIWYRETDGTETANVTVTTSGACRITYNLYRMSGYSGLPVSAGWAGNTGSGITVQDCPALTTGFGAVDTLWFAVLAWGTGGSNVSAYPSGYSNGAYYTGGGTGPGIAAARKTSTAASEDPGTFTITANSWVIANTIAIKGAATPDAEFSYLETGVRTFDFTDLSTNTPTSWNWDFGDGSTDATIQNPVHVYAVAGVYTVRLDVTNASGTDFVTHDVSVTDVPPYEAPSPGLAILEIYVNDPAGPKWDEATWDGANWGDARWVDVTPQGVQCRIQWGSTRPEQGILAVPEAANWFVSFYDPNRLLDPANEDSPYWPDLRPGLPIRIRHRGITVKTGQADVISHAMVDDTSTVRGSDIISLMARAMVPDATILSNTLVARAQDAIAAAGLSINVSRAGMARGDAVGITDDPPLGAQLDGERTVWQHILDAAQSVLWMPFVTRDNDLHFRSYSVPVNAGKALASPNLVDLQSIVDTAGLYSEVHVQQTVADGGAVITRAITPPPWFGRRIFERTEETPDSDTWADTVLADRSLNTLRWAPGDVVPFTADQVEYFAVLQPVELVALQMTETSPTIDASAIILGGTIEAVGKQDDSARWRFTFEAAASSLVTGDAPLYADGGTPADYLTSESGSEYLYPD